MLIGAFAAAFFIVASWTLAVGVFAFFVGLAYFIAGLVTRPAAPSKEEPPAEPALAEEKTSTKTGPGWHCTWCWAPLEKGSKYCNACGHRIE